MKTDAEWLSEFASLINLVISIPVAPEAINRRSTIAGDLMMDSISLVSLMALSEEAFSVSLAEHAEAIANIKTVGDALDIIRTLHCEPA